MGLIHSEKMRFRVLLLLLLLAALAFKLVYLKTAEHSYNSEELPLAALTLAGKGTALADASATRLYGTAPITTAAGLWLFGFTITGLKFFSILFGLLFLYLMSLVGKRYFREHGSLVGLMPAGLLVLGPPVVQIWGIKNRGGFIENLAALAFCLWVYLGAARKGRFSSLQKLVLAIVVGVATWSQPMALTWGIVLLGFVLWHEFLVSPRQIPRSIALLLTGFALGVMPLININFLFNLRTFDVLGSGEVPGGVNLTEFERLRGVFTEGLPRLLGLKEQWEDDWVLSAPAAWLLYLAFVLPSIWGSLTVLGGFIRTRKPSPGLMLICIALALIAANVATTWGNFLGEPRRLLLLYVPFAMLTVAGLLRARMFAAPYLLLWCAFSAWANYSYISKNRNGVSGSHLYQPLHEVTRYLSEKGIGGIYSDVWTGGRITFASEGAIPWFRSDYDETTGGYIGDSLLTGQEAMLFNLALPSGRTARDRFVSDLRGAKLDCEESSVQGISIIHRCSQEIDLKLLPIQAMSGRYGTGDAIIYLRATDNNVHSIVGSKTRAGVSAKGQAGYLMFGPYWPLPAGNYRLEVEGRSGKPFVIDVASDRGELIHARLEMKAALDNTAGKLARLEFTLLRPVTDVEFRMQVPAGSDAEIRGYKVIVR